MLLKQVNRNAVYFMQEYNITVFMSEKTITDEQKNMHAVYRYQANNLLFYLPTILLIIERIKGGRRIQTTW